MIRLVPSLVLIFSLAAAAGVLLTLATDVEGCDCAPTQPQREVFKQWQAFEKKADRP